MRVSRRRWLISTSVITLLLVAAAIAVASRVPLTSNVMRQRVVAALADRLDADVELDALALRIYPRLRASGAGLRVYFHHRRDVRPLIAIGAFAVSADLVGLWRHRVAKVELQGLEINIPPADVRHAVSAEEPAPASSTGAEGADAASAGDAPSGRDFIIERVEAPDAQLTVLRADPDKSPRVWYMHRLFVRDVGVGRSMPYETFLTNAVPPGQIAATGHFGPWQRDEPGTTPLDGTFTFENADLSVFKGISGILSAAGRFAGTLERITVDGTTTTPDFMVNVSGHPVPLETTYHAVVDGTNGNTTLDPVDARFRDTRLVASGGVYEQEGVKGREIRLDVSLEGGRLEDVLRLVVPTAQPTMTGVVSLASRMVIPPGPADIVDKLALDGRFTIAGGRFTDPGVQRQITTLSARARGNDAGTATTRVRSNFAGRFTLDRGRLSLPSLTFDVPGAVVSLAGAYTLRRERLQFAGTLYMDAKLSQTVDGWKSWLLKAADPLFRRQGRTRVPLRISGTRDAPKFGLDLKRVFKR